MVKFVVTEQHFYWWPVKVRRPKADPRQAGHFDVFEFKAQFEDIDTDEAEAIIAEVNELPVRERAARQHDLLLRVVKDWDQDVIDADKNPIPFDGEIFRELLKKGWFAAAMWRAWGEAQRGEGGRKGN